MTLNCQPFCDDVSFISYYLTTFIPVSEGGRGGGCKPRTCIPRSDETTFTSILTVGSAGTGINRDNVGNVVNISIWSG